MYRLRRKEKERKLASKIRERRAIYYSILWLVDELARLLTSMKMRQKMRTYYKGERLISVDEYECGKQWKRSFYFHYDFDDGDEFGKEEEEKELGLDFEYVDVLRCFIQEFFSLSCWIDILSIRDGRCCRNRFRELHRVVLSLKDGGGDR